VSAATWFQLKPDAAPTPMACAAPDATVKETAVIIRSLRIMIFSIP
jgi:hypothetical protein